MRIAVLMLFFGTFGSSLQAQNDSLKLPLKRTVVWTANTVIPVGVHLALYKTWFASYPTTPFHFTDDNHEWKQMDKVGHGFSSYYIAINSAASFRWAGYNKRTSAILGSGVALGFQYAIEYFDGRSAGWGASKGDLIANTVGIAAGGLQSGIWGKVKIPVCITFQPSYWSDYRPELLGSTFLEKRLKDYNAQTYWVSVIPRLLNEKTKFPKWLGISLGYSANGMVGGEDNIWIKDSKTYDMSYVVRKRQFYISPSIALGYIHTRYGLLNALLKITDHWRLPVPALEWNNPGKFNFHWIYW